MLDYPVLHGPTLGMTPILGVAGERSGGICRNLLRDVWIEKRNQHGLQSKPIPVRWQLHWEVTDRKDTWSDEFFVAIRAYVGAMEMLEMTKEHSENNFERKTTWATVAIDI